MSLKLQVAFVALVQHYLFIYFSLVIKKEGNQQEHMGNIFCHSIVLLFFYIFFFIGHFFPVSNLSKRGLSHTSNPLLQPKDSEKILW